MRDVGIENLSVYLPMYSLSLDELAKARGVDPQKHRLGREHRRYLPASG